MKSFQNVAYKNMSLQIFQKQRTITILVSGMVLDSETFYNDSLFTIPTAAIDKIEYLQYCQLFLDRTQ